MAEDLRRRYPPDPNAPNGVPGVLRGGPPELYAEIPDELLEQAIADPEQLEAIRAIGMRSVMVVPMRAGEQTLGALTLVTADSGRRFTEDDFAFAQDLALRAATAIQNARLYEEQVRVAHTLQASLLPERLPELPGWSGAASYQAGEQGAEVGGDFYDIVAAGGGRHLVFLGDVTGKGIAAAALTAPRPPLAAHRRPLRSAARGASCELVNDILVEQPRLAPVTLVCALIDGARMTVAAAGHPPPLLRRAGKVVELGPTGILLGAVGGQTFREETVELRPGDTVLLYTDGVTDTPGADDRFGPERLVGHPQRRARLARRTSSSGSRRRCASTSPAPRSTTARCSSCASRATATPSSGCAWRRDYDLSAMSSAPPSGAGAGRTVTIQFESGRRIAPDALRMSPAGATLEVDGLLRAPLKLTLGQLQIGHGGPRPGQGPRRRRALPDPQTAVRHRGRCRASRGSRAGCGRAPAARRSR